MTNYEKKIKALVPKSEDAKTDKSDIILMLGTDSSDDEWKEEYEEYIKDYPDAVVQPKPEKKKITIKKKATPKKVTVKKKAPVTKPSPKPEKVAEKKEVTVTKPSSKPKEKETNHKFNIGDTVFGNKNQKFIITSRLSKMDDDFYYNAKNKYGRILRLAEKELSLKPHETKKEQPSQVSKEDQSKVEKDLKEIYDKYKSDKAIKAMELSFAGKGKLHQIKDKPTPKSKEQKQKEEPKRYGTRMIEEHDKLITNRAKIVSKPAIAVLKKTKASEKENAKIISIGESIGNSIAVLSADIDDHLLQKNEKEASIIDKGFRALVLASISHENLMEKFQHRPLALKSLNDLGYVKVKVEKNKIVAITLNPKIADKIKSIRESILSINKEILARGGELKKECSIEIRNDNEVTINGIKVDDNDDIFDMLDYRVRERSEIIERIKDYMKDKEQNPNISTPSDSDYALMSEDVEYLKTLKDKYIFDSLGTNEYIAKSDNAERFEEICSDFVEYYNERN